LIFIGILLVKIPTTKTTDNAVMMPPSPKATTTISAAVTDTPGSCTSHNQVLADGKGTISIKCGDTITLTVNCKMSTGYRPFPPSFNNSEFELLSYNEKSEINGMAGGDNTTGTYIFKSLKKTPSSKIEVGIYKPWEPSSQITQQTVLVTVL
jgi:hypothetical protein